MDHQFPECRTSLRESSGAAAELARAVRISLCGLDLGRPASFLPSSQATADFDWQKWLRGPFVEQLGGAFMQVFQAAGQTQVRELMQIDSTLPGERSREAGASLLARLEQAKNLRTVERIREVLGDAPGPHFTTAFAVECAEFHLPLRPALVSYLYGEWRCGMSAVGGRGNLDAFATAGAGVTNAVLGEVLSSGASPFDQAAGL